ncbi:MAG: hypothetical protein ABF314_21335, partial [Nocardioides sp.]
HDVPARIEALALAAGLGREAAHSQLASALDVVLHLERDRTGRRLAQVAVPRRDERGLVEMSLAAQTRASPAAATPGAGARVVTEGPSLDALLALLASRLRP